MQNTYVRRVQADNKYLLVNTQTKFVTTSKAKIILQQCTRRNKYNAARTKFGGKKELKKNQTDNWKKEDNMNVRCEERRKREKKKVRKRERGKK